MNNEETKTLNLQMNSNANNATKGHSNSSFAQRAAATVAAATVGGAALGSGAAFAAENMVNETPEVTPEEPQETKTEDIEILEVSANPVSDHVIHQTYVVGHPAETPDPNAIPADAEFIDDGKDIHPVPDSDNEIHVLGVDAVETAYGTQAIMVGLEASNGDRAVVVDVDSDGTIDYLAHDDNGDGHIDISELHDVHNFGVPTEAYFEAFAGTQTDNDDIMMASHDMPDYMNDADTGLIDA